MAEVEIHTGHDHASDPFGRRVSVMVGVIGILLAVVTISSHREHTASVVHQTKANDQWAFYQAKKIREHLLDASAATLEVLGNDSSRSAPTIAKFKSDRERYAKDAADIQRQAKGEESESEHSEHRALRFDVGEGFLELGLVLCSLYFLSKNRLFPTLGILAATLGAVVGISGWFV